MLGPTESGKTTFLCALKKALLEHDEEWVLFTRDAASQRQLDEMSSALISEGGFPMPTRTVDTIRWILGGTVERRERKGRFGGEIKTKDQVEITLRLTDAPGGLGSADRVGLSELMGVVSQEPGYEGKLPHRLAVCVTKLDDPRVFRTAHDLGMLVPDDSSRWGFPRVHETDAQALFHALGEISRSGNGEVVPRLLERYFYPERISYYITSAVGFMVNKQTRRFDPRDPENVYRTASGAPLVRGPVHPINVVEPILWIIRQLAPVT